MFPLLSACHCLWPTVAWQFAGPWPVACAEESGQTSGSCLFSWVCFPFGVAPLLPMPSTARHCPLPAFLLTMSLPGWFGGFRHRPHNSPFRHRDVRSPVPRKQKSLTLATYMLFLGNSLTLATYMLFLGKSSDSVNLQLPAPWCEHQS